MVNIRTIYKRLSVSRFSTSSKELLSTWHQILHNAHADSLFIREPEKNVIDTRDSNLSPPGHAYSLNTN